MLLSRFDQVSRFPTRYVPWPKTGLVALWKGRLVGVVETLVNIYDTVDGRNQLRLVVYPMIYKVVYIPGGAGFLNHQQ